MDDKLLNKFQKMYGPDNDDLEWSKNLIYPKLPLLKRAWLRTKRIANYKVW